MRRMYSENQVVKVLEDKDVKVKTIAQSEANYSFSFELIPSSSDYFLTHGSQYCKIEIVNGELHIIGVACFDNTDSDNNHNLTFSSQQITIPEYIADKIYNAIGEKLTQSPTGTDVAQKIIRIVPMGYQGNVYGIAALRLEHIAANIINLSMGTGITVLAGKSITVSFEANLSLF